MAEIAVCMPGKMGDAIYALYLSRQIAARHHAPVDFFTSAYCEPLRDLVEYQSSVDKMIVPAEYQVANMGCGIQPWQMPVPDHYEKVYQLGFKTTPNKFLGDWMADEAGIMLGQMELDVPVIQPPAERYYTMGLRGSPDYARLGQMFVEMAGIPVVEVGGRTDRVSSQSIDMTGRSFLETAAIIGQSAGYIGLMSAMLVVANGFSALTKIAVHDGIHWDMRHVYRGPNNFYPVKPTAQEVLNVFQSNA